MMRIHYDTKINSMSIIIHIKHKFEEAHLLSFLGYTLEEQHLCYCFVQESINAALFFATRYNQCTFCLQPNTIEKKEMHQILELRSWTFDASGMSSLNSFILSWISCLSLGLDLCSSFFPLSCFISTEISLCMS